MAAEAEVTALFQKSRHFSFAQTLKGLKNV